MVSGSGSSSKSESRPVDITPPEFRALRGPTGAGFEALFAGGMPGFENPLATGEQVLQGRLVAPMTAGEQTALGGIREAVNVPTEADLASERLLEGTLEGRFLMPDSNPFLQASIESAQRPVVESFEDATRGTRNLFGQAGQGRLPASSPFAQAQALSERGLANALGDISTNLSAENFARERGLQAAAVEQQRQVNAQRFGQLTTRLEAEALPRLIEDLGVQRGLEEFDRRLDLLARALVAAGSLSSQFGTESEASSTGASAGILGKPSNTSTTTTT